MVVWLWRLACVLLVLVLPGRALRGVLPGGQGRSWLERQFLYALLSVTLTSVLGLTLAWAGCFSWRVLLSMLAVCCAGATVLRRRRARADDRRAGPISREDRLVVLLGCVVLAIVARPHEYVGGGWDPGVYLQAGAHLAGRGELNYQDPFFGSLTREQQDVFDHRRQGWTQRFPGFRIVDRDAGRVSPQFYPGYMVWTALAYALGGVPLALRVNVWFALLSLVAVYLTGRHMFGRRAGMLAALLLGANAVQLWFTRFSTSELMTQCLVWSALYLFTRYESRREAGDGLLAAVCLGLAFMTRISAIMYAVPVTMVLYWRWLAGRRHAMFVAAAVVTGCIVSLCYSRFMARPYFDLVRAGRIWGAAYVEVWGPAVVLLVSVGLAGGRTRQRVAELVVDPRVRGVAAAVLAALCGFAFFVRPEMVVSSGTASVLEGDARRRLLSSASSFRDLRWYVTVVGLAGGVAGMIRFLVGSRRPGGAVVLGCVVTAGVVFFHRKMVEPFFMFTLRRFVPVVIPGGCLFLGAALADVWAWRGRAGRWVCCGLAAVVVLMPLRHAWRGLVQPDFPGALAMCGQVAQSLRARQPDIVVCEGTWLAAPLHFFYGFETLGMSDKSGKNRRAAAALMGAWAAEGRVVCFVSKRGPDAVMGTVPWEKFGEVRGQFCRLERTLTRPPQKRECRTGTWGLWQARGTPDGS